MQFKRLHFFVLQSVWNHLVFLWNLWTLIQISVLHLFSRIMLHLMRLEWPAEEILAIICVWNQTRHFYCSNWNQRRPQDSSFEAVTPFIFHLKHDKLLQHCVTWHLQSQLIRPDPSNSPGMSARSSLVTKGRWSYFCRNPLTFLSASPALLRQNQHEAKSCQCGFRRYYALFCTL